MLKMNKFMMLGVALVLLYSTSCIQVAKGQALGTSCVVANASTCDLQISGIYCSQTGNGTSGTCECQTSDGWFKNGTSCMKNGDVYGQCDSLVKCPANSKCKLYSGTTLKSEYRCQCEDSYIPIKPKNATDKICAKQLTPLVDSTCTSCIKNGGKCYDSNGDNKKDGCQCLISKSGDNCEILHVNVTCDLSTFMMRVCYNTHPQFNLSTTSLMYSEGHRTTAECQAKKGTAAVCNGGYYIDFPLKNPTCGVKGVQGTVADSHRYEVRVFVVKDKNAGMGSDDINFVTYCQYDLAKNTKVGYYGDKDPQNSQGEHKTPTLEVGLVTKTGQRLPPFSRLKLSDKIRLEVNLTQDGSYSTMRVINMYAYVVYRSGIKGTPLPLVTDSCPAEGQPHLDDKNFFKTVTRDAKKQSVQTGDIKVFVLKDNTEEETKVTIHVTTKICLQGKEADCAKVSCTLKNKKFDSLSRKKRAVGSDGTANLESETSFNLDLGGNAAASTASGFMATGGFVGLVVVLAILLVACVVIIAIVITRTRHPKTEPTNEERIRHAYTNYALPRANPKHVRY